MKLAFSRINQDLKVYRKKTIKQAFSYDFTIYYPSYHIIYFR